jgi:hypothetical protein
MRKRQAQGYKVSLVSESLESLSLSLQCNGRGMQDDLKFQDLNRILHLFNVREIIQTVAAGTGLLVNGGESRANARGMIQHQATSTSPESSTAL